MMKTGTAAYGPSLRHRTLVVWLRERYLRRFPLKFRILAWVCCAGIAAAVGGLALSIAGPIIGETAFLAFTLVRYLAESSGHRRRARLAQRGKRSS